MKRQSCSHEEGGEIKPGDILAGHTSGIRALAERLRNMVLETIPTAVELAYPGWHSIGYHHSASGYFCGIFLRKDRIHFGFEFGVLLPDPNVLLEGTGKKVRYVMVKEEKDIRVGAIKELLRAATDLLTGREAKLWLVKSI